MAQQGYGKYQLSLKAGNDLLNVAADTADELFANCDALFGDGTGKEQVARFFVQQAFGNGSKEPGATALSLKMPMSATESGVVTSFPASNSTGESNNAPTEKQIKFAKTLGIQNADKLTRRELSAEIDKRKK